MDFTINNFKDLDLNRMEQVDKLKVEYKYDGKQARMPGHTMFSFNTITKEIKPAVIEHSVAVGFNRKLVYTHTVIKEKDCIYLQALNIKNVIKRIKRIGYEY